jgi:hypothetical protein
MIVNLLLRFLVARNCIIAIIPPALYPQRLLLLCNSIFLFICQWNLFHFFITYLQAQLIFQSDEVTEYFGLPKIFSRTMDLGST